MYLLNQSKLFRCRVLLILASLFLIKIDNIFSKSDKPSGNGGVVKDIKLSGIASWYGDKYQGRTTANGEKFDMYKMTGAHKNIPFNTFVRVTNLKNNKKVVIRINDRGPFIGDRILDVSKIAAQKLGFLSYGVASVSIEVLSKPLSDANDKEKQNNNIANDDKKTIVLLNNKENIRNNKSVNTNVYSTQEDNTNFNISKINSSEYVKVDFNISSIDSNKSFKEKYRLQFGVYNDIYIAHSHQVILSKKVGFDVNIFTIKSFSKKRQYYLMSSLEFSSYKEAKEYKENLFNKYILPVLIVKF